MQQVTKNRNIFLDLFKYFLCFLVISIHLTGNDFTYKPLYRLAVPMFFLISGYFIYSDDSNTLKTKSINFIKRTVGYMLIGFLIYIMFDFIMCFIDGKGVGYYFTTLFYEDFLLEFFVLNRPITYTGAQLWFLIALFVISLIHFVLVKFNKTHYYKIIIPVCFTIYFFFAGYMYLLQNTDMPIRYTRNALFFGLPNFALGFMLRKINFHKKNWYKYIYLVLGCFFFLLQFTEHNLIKTENMSLEMYISSVLSAVFFLQFFVGIKNANCPFYYKWIGKNGPFYVYILHMAVSVVLSRITSFDNVNTNAFVVLLISFSIYEIAYLLHVLFKKYNSNKIKHQQ